MGEEFYSSNGEPYNPYRAESILEGEPKSLQEKFEESMERGVAFEKIIDPRGEISILETDIRIDIKEILKILSKKDSSCPEITKLNNQRYAKIMERSLEGKTPEEIRREMNLSEEEFKQIGNGAREYLSSILRERDIYQGR